MTTETIAFLFKCINLAVFFGGAYYLVVSRLVPLIKDRMNVDAEQLAEQKHQQTLLSTTLNNLTETIDQNKKTANYLQQQVVRWQNHLAQQRELRKAEEHRCYTMFNKRREQKNAQRDYDIAIKQLMPDVFKRVEDAVGDYYKNPVHAHEAVHNVITSLEKSE